MVRDSDRKTLDINPRDPDTGVRPNPVFGRVDRNQSTGERKYKALYAKLEKRYTWNGRGPVEPLTREVPKGSGVLKRPRGTGSSRGEQMVGADAKLHTHLLLNACDAGPESGVILPRDGR